MIRRRSTAARKGRAAEDIVVARPETERPTVAEETFEDMATTGEVPAIGPESRPRADPGR